MARRKAKPARETQETPPSPKMPAPSQDATPPALPAATGEQVPASQEKRWTSSLPDPFGRDGINLGDGRRLQFNRSSRWQQMQIKFVAIEKGVDPKPRKEDGDTQWLRDRGWDWKSDPDTRAWTVQLLRPEEKELPALEKARRRAAVDKQAQEDFVELAQRIRARNGLPPVSDFAADRGPALG